MSGSMEPSIPVGGLIIVKPANEYKQNDVITFSSTQKKNDYTTHRINQVRGGGESKSYTTKGDANENPDFENVSEDRIVGKLIYSIPIVGYILWFVKTLPGLIIIILIPALIIIYDEVDKIKKEFKQIKDKGSKKTIAETSNNQKKKLKKATNEKSD